MHKYISAATQKHVVVYVQLGSMKKKKSAERAFVVSTLQP